MQYVNRVVALICDNFAIYINIEDIKKNDLH